MSAKGTFDAKSGTHRFRVVVSDKDKRVLKWIESQSDFSFSAKAAMQIVMAMYGTSADLKDLLPEISARLSAATMKKGAVVPVGVVEHVPDVQVQSTPAQSVPVQPPVTQPAPAPAAKPQIQSGFGKAAAGPESPMVKRMREAQGGQSGQSPVAPESGISTNFSDLAPMG